MEAQPTLVLGTGNVGKAAEFRRLLGRSGWHLVDLSEFPNGPSLSEDGLSYAQNARAKATHIARHTGAWTLADDTGLEVDALHGAPGIRSARFAGPTADAAANRHRLLEELGTTPLEQRSARFVCHLVLADSTGAIRGESTGRCAGRILFRSAGDGGFGYDGLFEILEYHRTLAQLGLSATACLSHRARAVRNLWPELRATLQKWRGDEGGC